MTLVTLLATLAAVVGLMLAVGALVIVGWTRLVRVRSSYRERFREVVPYLVLLGGVLLVNNLTREAAPEVSWLIGWNLTGIIYSIEGSFVASVQSFSTPLLTHYFSFMYIYGYVFVLTFPLLAYFALDDMQFLRETCVAYTLNYAIGLLWYVAFIAYGPRNLMPDIVEPLLYTSWPEAKMLTTRVNTNTNVFPSLHSSLAATVLLLAYRTREHYPAWLLLAAVFSGSIVVSTMYLGIHWGIDVVAGGVLAFISVRVATNVDESSADRYRSRLSDNRISRHLGSIVGRLRTLVDVRR